jgi:L-ascorbate metabolism protein UlaG (beta-lactamase superfamily)
MPDRWPGQGADRRVATGGLACRGHHAHLAIMTAQAAVSDHFDGIRFFNPDIGLTPDRRGFWQLLQWRFGSTRASWPAALPNAIYPPPVQPGAQQAAITFIGHATFLIQLPGITLLTDPMFSDRASPVTFAGPRRVRAPGLSLAALPKIDLIVLSHNHYDHADLPSLRALHGAHRPAAMTLAGNAGLMAKAGFNATTLEWWQETRLGPLRVTATPARHFSRRSLVDGNRALWGGFMLEHDGARILFAGDSGSGPHWTEIRRRLGPPDLAMLPIGAYEPRWLMGPVHMNPEEAVRAHQDLEAAQSIGMHFGTFQLTDEAVGAPEQALVRACRDHGVTNFGVLDVGETQLMTLPAMGARPGMRSEDGA